MSIHQQFVLLLEQLTASDNHLRNTAEKKYESIKLDPSMLPLLPLSMLSVLGDEAVAAHIKQLAAVLLRRLLIEEEVSIYRIMDTDK